jgi:hypothetical protein
MQRRYHRLLPILPVIALGAFVAPLPASESKIQGFYSNMEPSVDQGSLVGTEVFILPHIEDGEVAYTALVQFADGLPARPQLVDLDVRDRTISFSAVHPEKGEIRFSGSIDGDGLTGRFDVLGDIMLPRGESIWQWGAGGD